MACDQGPSTSSAGPQGALKLGKPKVCMKWPSVFAPSHINQRLDVGHLEKGHDLDETSLISNARKEELLLSSSCVVLSLMMAHGEGLSSLIQNVSDTGSGGERERACNKFWHQGVTTSNA